MYNSSENPELAQDSENRQFEEDDQDDSNGITEIPTRITGDS
jgi:hypothetical protein